MTDEYHHPIWINDRALSLDFHLVSSFLSEQFLFFDKHMESTALRFHYASLTPRAVLNKRIWKLARHLEKTSRKKVFVSWFNRYRDDLPNHLVLLNNWLIDIQILREETESNKNGASVLHRKTIPAADPVKDREFLRRFDLFLAKKSQESEPS